MERKKYSLCLCAIARGRKQQLVDEFGEACPSQARKLSARLCTHIYRK